MHSSIAAVALAVFLAATTTMSFADRSHQAQANRMTEITITGGLNRADPFNDTIVDAVFTEPDGRERRVPAFWAGGRTWKVRYASPAIGLHRFRTECADPTDTGLHGIEGSIDIKPYSGDNPLLRRGPLRVAKGSRYFEHADGTPFLWLGDTWWMGLTSRLSWPDGFKKLAADRKGKGFNLIQIVAGLYPDMPAFDDRGANEAGFPWEKEYARIRPEYFDAADRKIFYLVEQGFVPCIVSTWGYHLPWLGQEKMKQHQRYVHARWGALPMVWCVAGEITLPYYLEPDFPRSGPKQTAEWEKMIAYCRSINAFDRMITGHPSMPHPMSMRANLKNPVLLDFDMLQTPHGQVDALAPTVETVRHSYAAKPPMPVVNAEPSYEMLFDRTPAAIARLMFWVSWASGVKGYTYGANGIWQVNGRDKPYGKSPHGGDYGKIAWEDAMNLAGSTQVALGKKLLEQYPWQRFEPRAGWAAWAGAPADIPMGDWIWFPEGNPAQDAPVAARYFRRVFDLPEKAKVKRATLQIAADDRCTIWLNGKQIGSHENWRVPVRFENLAQARRAGRNVLAIRADNGKADVSLNPGGLNGAMLVEREDGNRIEIKTDAQWRASRAEVTGWPDPDLNDDDWVAAMRIAGYGDAPWGNIAESPANPYMVPYAMGIDRDVRMIYVPESRRVIVKDLEPDVRYSAFYFNPQTGERKPAPAVKRDAAGDWPVDAPSLASDWVLVLEAGD